MVSVQRTFGVRRDRSLRWGRFRYTRAPCLASDRDIPSERVPAVSEPVAATVAGTMGPSGN